MIGFGSVGESSEGCCEVMGQESCEGIGDGSCHGRFVVKVEVDCEGQSVGVVEDY